MGFGDLMERPGTGTDADIVDENIEPAEPFEAGRDHARRVGGIGDIARTDQPLAAEFAHEIESRLCPIRFAIVEGDARPFELGSAPCRERGWHYVSIQVGA